MQLNQLLLYYYEIKLISLSALLYRIHNASTEQTFALDNYITRNTAHELTGNSFLSCLFITFNI